MSHALRVRGLKQIVNAFNHNVITVARSTRAWIETDFNVSPMSWCVGRTLYACVD